MGCREAGSGFTPAIEPLTSGVILSQSQAPAGLPHLLCDMEMILAILTLQVGRCDD